MGWSPLTETSVVTAADFTSQIVMRARVDRAVTEGECRQAREPFEDWGGYPRVSAEIAPARVEVHPVGGEFVDR